MKRIKIDKVQAPDPKPVYVWQTKYRVALGNGVRKQFTSRKLALAFLADTNRFLNLKLHEANLFYGEVFTEYRNNWFYFGENADRSEIKCENLLQQIREPFKLLVTRSNWMNGNDFTWKHLHTIFELLLQVLAELRALHRQKSKYAELRRILIIESRIQFAQSQLNRYAASVEMAMQPLDETAAVQTQA